LSCSGAGTCNGGIHINAIKHYTRSQANLETIYPYSDFSTQVTGKPKTCDSNLNRGPIPTARQSFMLVPVLDRTGRLAESSMDQYKRWMGVVANTAVSMSMHAVKNFYRYTTGIYENSQCLSQQGGGHAVTIVGYSYDRTTNTGFWRVRNTWGPNWGEFGYFRIKMDTRRDGLGECNMYLRGSFIQW